MALETLPVLAERKTYTSAGKENSNMTIINRIAIVLLTILLHTSCKKPLPTEGALDVWLTDGPAAYKAINIDVQKVEVKYEDESKGNHGWVTMQTNAGIYNLLAPQVTTGKHIAFDHSLLLGRIAKLKLHLGNNNTLVKTEGDTIALQLPPGSEIQVCNINNDISIQYNLQVELEFDTKKSIEPSDNGFSFTPAMCIKRIGFH